MSRSTLSQGKRRYKAIIVGGGVAGLGCARTLSEQSVDDFLLISPDLLGRAPHSADGDVNYGAYYVRSDYHHLLPFVTVTRRFNYWRDFFINRRGHRSLLDPRNIAHLPALVRFYFVARRLYHQYRRLQKRAIEVSQRVALEELPELKRFFSIPAMQAINELGLEYWDKYYFSHIARATAFLSSEEMDAASYGATLLPLFVSTYEFRIQLEKLIEPFEENILTDRVEAVSRCAGGWEVRTRKNGNYTADYLVLATPINETKRLVSIQEETNKSVEVHMFHVRGNLKEKYQGYDMVLLDSGSKDCFLSTEKNGTHVFYTKNARPDLEKYFDHHMLIAERHWNPAFFLGGHFIEADRGNGLYCIGDHSMAFMEDAFITGVYAANHIVKGEHA